MGQDIQRFKNLINKRFEMEDLGDCSFFLVEYRMDECHPIILEPNIGPHSNACSDTSGERNLLVSYWVDHQSTYRSTPDVLIVAGLQITQVRTITQLALRSSYLTFSVIFYLSFHFFLSLKGTHHLPSYVDDSRNCLSSAVYKYTNVVREDVSSDLRPKIFTLSNERLIIPNSVFTLFVSICYFHLFNHKAFITIVSTLLGAQSPVVKT
ncbi:hypothetical protein CROQUDRAFT_515713 [Cronartium quercuum f. sp. fusiforme G11]|uniref:Uncharacterized protein n=1 Tax=Cronartium quercuum f. sp. fusiforme G11 TaxID=708437 RepID=A0A9P6N505_9BASI|nr:hypothetical protein CROQUDRAFT_515713 [Cronartium quercuum f. sp. fusiforme G11]